jgi:2-polyprenyl-3-methyl-5-hydroxy-6-metoxy-1,4-benzoquinol methylase|tara:strand:+ start:564 stop:1184 length:621 start_codon:yes stop_codon:yes gene_type:complete
MFKNLIYKNPNHHIIKKNLFIRDFENLYKNIKDPWNQHENFLKEETVIFAREIIKNISKNKNELSLLDVGAGQGSLKKILKSNIKYLGTDIHKKKFKNVKFDDINIYNSSFKNKFDIIVCFKTIYYLADNIDIVINNFKDYLKKNGFIIISYNSKTSSYSNKFLTDLILRSKLVKIFKEIYTIEINRNLYEQKNKEKDTLFVFKKK